MRWRPRGCRARPLRMSSICLIHQELLGKGGPDPVTPDTLKEYLLRDADSWRRVCEAARRITAELQRCWDEERANRAEQVIVEHDEDIVNMEARRTAAAAARNKRRNDARRATRAQRREERSTGLRLTPPALPTTVDLSHGELPSSARYIQRQRQQTGRGLLAPLWRSGAAIHNG